MTTIVKIDGEAIGVAEFIADLEADRAVRGAHRAACQGPHHGAWRQESRASGCPTEEIQERADQFRRVRGLHRASDTNKYLDAMRVSLDEFEAFITDGLYQEKMMEQVCSDAGRARRTSS